MSVSFLFIGFVFTSPATANNGMPERLLSGEFGQRINQYKCFFEYPCVNDISTSESSYVIHGWNSIPQEDHGAGQPFTFQFFVDGQEVHLQRFAYQGSHDPHVIAYFFYQIFDPGTFSVGSHNTMGIWSDLKGTEVFISYGTLEVTP